MSPYDTASLVLPECLPFAVDLQFAKQPFSGSLPARVRILPSGTFRGVDGRGPFTLDDAEAVIAASMAEGPLPIDENHATDLAKGRGAPARGWIVAIESAADGLWATVEWTAEGRRLVEGRAYRGISPVILTEKGTGRVMRVLRAALTNAPNLALNLFNQELQGTEPMLMNSSSLQTLNVGFNTAFKTGLGQAAPQWGSIATRVPSSTREEEYGWIGMLPNVREWLGPRHVHSLAAHGYAIKNKDYELTIAVRRNDIEDDNIGIYKPLFEEMGRAAGAHYDQIVYGLLKNGWETPCYDGQNFFDFDHPVLNADGATVSVANTDGGTGEPWFLVDDSRPLKPVILQVRREFELIRKADPRDDSVFYEKEFVYGVDGRCNVGFGFWQFCWGSRQTLDYTRYAAARFALGGMKGDYGKPLGLRPRKLFVGPANEEAALKILNNDTLYNGESNHWRGTAELIVVPWLA